MSADKRTGDAPSGLSWMATCALIAFTRRGCTLAKHLASGLEQQLGSNTVRVTVHGPARYADELGIRAYESLGAWTAEQFGQACALVYVGATGIAVRAIAPHVRDKFSDPAVVSVDEAGRFAVPLLSGHVGGANELARTVAQLCGGQAVVSTATDVNELFAVDEWAARRGFAIKERAVAKKISATLLEGGTVGFVSDFDLNWEPPAGVVALGAASDVTPAFDGRPAIGFAVSLDDACQPFGQTLHLVPRIATVGVGCRRDTDPDVLERAVDAALATARVSTLAVCALASIDVKSDEPAILQLAQKRGWNARFYSADELAAVPGDFESSEFVRRTVGVDNVCERAALARGGTLLLGKQAGNGTTVALSIQDVYLGSDPKYTSAAERNSVEKETQ